MSMTSRQTKPPNGASKAITRYWCGKPFDQHVWYGVEEQDGVEVYYGWKNGKWEIEDAVLYVGGKVRASLSCFPQHISVFMMQPAGVSEFQVTSLGEMRVGMWLDEETKLGS